jgi:predicted negative regulator of RcsB-dependent stress response
MAYDLEEQEQLAALKAWWNQYGTLITWLLTLGLLAYAGWTYWNYYQGNQAAQAAQLFEEVQKAASDKDAAKVQRAATDVQQRFGKTIYAEMAALAAAKAAFDAGDAKTAKSHLQWVIDQGADDEFKVIARVRLAGVLLDEKAYEEGLKVLAVDVPESFVAVVADRRGDILAAQSKIDEARTAYRDAIAKTDERDPSRQLIQLKLDALGGNDKAA